MERLRRTVKKVKISKPLDAMKNGIAYLPEDRKVDGIVGDLSVRENIMNEARGYVLLPIVLAPVNSKDYQGITLAHRHVPD